MIASVESLHPHVRAAAVERYALAVCFAGSEDGGDERTMDGLESAAPIALVDDLECVDDHDVALWSKKSAPQLEQWQGGFMFRSSIRCRGRA